MKYGKLPLTSRVSLLARGEGFEKIPVGRVSPDHAVGVKRGDDQKGDTNAGPTLAQLFRVRRRRVSFW